MIIGFGYRARAGKDHAADILVREYGYKKLRFSEPLYKIAFVLCGLPPHLSDMVHYQSWFKRRWHWISTPWRWLRIPVKGRWLLQWLGTDIMREANPNIWVALLRHKIQTTPGNYVIPDVRFINEMLAIWSLGGEVVHIHRPSLGPEKIGHISEKGADLPWNITLENDDTENFEKQVRALGEKYKDA